MKIIILALLIIATFSLERKMNASTLIKHKRYEVEELKNKIAKLKLVNFPEHIVLKSLLETIKEELIAKLENKSYLSKAELLFAKLYNICFDRDSINKESEMKTKLDRFKEELNEREIKQTQGISNNHSSRLEKMAKRTKSIELELE